LAEGIAAINNALTSVVVALISNGYLHQLLH
jgi:hypothetical protein